LHIVTIETSAGPDESIVFTPIEDDGIVLVQTAQHRRAWQGGVTQMEERFREEVRYFTDTGDSRVSVTYSPGDSQPVNFDPRDNVQIEQ
jgi:hypothetical protein